MTASDLLLQGEPVRAIMEIFTRTSGESFFFGVVFLSFLGIVYIQTQNIAVPLFLFLTISGTLLLGHLSTFTAPVDIIPAPFAPWVYILIAGGLTAVILWVWWKR